LTYRSESCRLRLDLVSPGDGPRQPRRRRIARVLRTTAQ
jgi:hypothetical protein